MKCSCANCLKTLQNFAEVQLMRSKKHGDDDESGGGVMMDDRELLS